MYVSHFFLTVFETRGPQSFDHLVRLKWATFIRVFRHRATLHTTRGTSFSVPTISSHPVPVGPG